MTSWTLVDAARLITMIRPQMEAASARWMLAGGFAMAAWGAARTTFDLDLVIDESSRPEVLAHLRRLGFETLVDSEGFSNLLHPDWELGRLDLMWVGGETSRRLFEGAHSRLGPDGKPLLVPSPVHLVAMKLRAIQNQPTRVIRDSPDLQHLLALPGMDDNEVRGYFERAGLLELYGRLKPSR